MFESSVEILQNKLDEIDIDLVIEQSNNFTTPEFDIRTKDYNYIKTGTIDIVDSFIDGIIYMNERDK